jgi:hypothetical protein
MFSRITKHLTYARIATTLALVFAMSGGAFAASKIRITSTKQISPKVLKALKGNTGPTGPAGVAGPVGPQGPRGETGPAGKDGLNGADGIRGEKGETGVAGPPGATGPEGVCSTANCVLPKGVTETGSWSFSTSNEEIIVTTISFAIPLAAPFGESAVHYVGPTDNVAACPGTAKEPKAQAGNLCVYQGGLLGAQLIEGSETASTTIFTPGATLLELLQGEARGTSAAGAAIQFGVSEPGTHIGWGTWAVTAS